MTYSLIARSGPHVAAATASYSLAVGNAVPALAPLAGGVVSQAFTNRLLRHHVLAELRRGSAADAALAAVQQLDQEWEKRQVAILPWAGTGAAHTGSGCSDWAGHLVGTDYVAAGNLLAGPQVLADAAHVLETELEDLRAARNESAAGLAQALLNAMQAAEAAGGDARGRQSAALIVCAAAAPDTNPAELAMDLRVDDSEDPLGKLAELAALWQLGAVTPPAV